MKKLVLVLLIIAVAVWGVWVYKKDIGGRVDAVEKPVVKIGAMFPLTGNFAETGEASRKALAKAIEDANANPDNRLYYELIVDDDQSDMRRAQTIMNKYFAIDKVNVISTFYSMPARIVAPEATKRQVVHFNCSYANDILQSKYNFQNFVSLKAEARGVADFLKDKKADKVSLFFGNIGASDYLLNELTVLLDEIGIKYEVERFMPGERSFNISMRKFKDSDPKAIVVFSFEPELDIIAKEISLNQIDKMIVFPDFIAMSRNIELFEGMYNIGSVKMSDELREHIGFAEDENTSFAAYLYDTGSFIVEAFEKVYSGGSIPTGEEIADMLLSQKYYKGEVGDYILDDNGQFNSKVEVTVVRDGKMVLEN